jgi:hypothetical protein
MTKRWKRHSPEQIVRKLRDADAMLNAGKDLAAVLQALAVSQSTFDRWRNQYSGIKAEEAKRLKELEDENRRLKHIVADQALDTQKGPDRSAHRTSSGSRAFVPAGSSSELVSRRKLALPPHCNDADTIPNRRPAVPAACALHLKKSPIQATLTASVAHRSRNSFRTLALPSARRTPPRCPLTLEMWPGFPVV